MIRIRKSKDRGHAQHGWLESFHSFSFADYYDPEHSGFHDLLVINEDYIAPGKGFGTHSHRDMEIITYVLEGALEHKDSIGNTSVLTPGKVQRMSAGSGVRHSEFNHSQSQPLHLLQIWITPSTTGIQPSYEEKVFSADQRTNHLRVIVSPERVEGSIKIHQDASVFTVLLEDGKTLSHTLSSGRKAWIQVARGELELNGKVLQAGDGASVENENLLTFVAKNKCEALLFDLP